MDRIYKALVLNDYGGDQNYASMVKDGIKLIETRMNRLFTYRGDIAICCGAGKSVTANAGNALCIVDIWKGRAMNNTPEEIKAACIGWDINRKSLLLRNWRHFSRDFKFAPQAVTKNFQGIFTISLPDDVDIIDKPEILPFKEIELPVSTLFN